MEGLIGLYQDSLGNVIKNPDRSTMLYFEFRESDSHFLGGSFDQLENFVTVLWTSSCTATCGVHPPPLGPTKFP